ncbi:MAG TPA: hypothetical protein VJS92_18475 [Candidatus Polarisedimenticolaceae bacterium]|nr:hypothetical protein [Candidatus Polarisedimenticolaceae bacterium]
MREARYSWILAVTAVAGLNPVLAQQSANYRLGPSTFNAGGHPAAGTVLGSSGYRVTLDAIGDGLPGRSLAGASYSMEPGFVAPHRPPGEVLGLRFSSAQQLTWNAEPSVGSYNLYRGTLSTLAGLAYGSCLQTSLTFPATVDADPVPPGGGFFYLVTARNRLREEGTKGARSNGVKRAGNVCP